MAERDPRQIIFESGSLAAEVAPRVCPILLLVRDAAATDVDMARLRHELDEDRHRRMTINARHLRHGRHLRRGMTLRAATDILWTYSSPYLYELLVGQRRWSPSRYGRFIARCDDCRAADAGNASAGAPAGLNYATVMCGEDDERR